jgi:NitT/TauT family transport system substrate-binding protein
MRLTAAGPVQPAPWIRRPPRLGRGIAAVAGLGVILLAAGCSTGGGGGDGQVSSTLTVAAVPGVDNVPLFLAQQKGMFRADGVTVAIRKYATVNAEVQALASGRVDIAAGDYGPFLFAESQQKTAGIKIVTDGYDAAPGVLEVLTLPSSKISSPQQLEAKKIATPNTAILNTPPGKPDSLETAATTSVLSSYGVDTVDWQPMAPGREVNALAQHKVSAILVTEPYIYQAESKLGAVELLDACSGATAGLPLSGYFAMGVWSQQNATALADFKSALGQAQASSAMAGPVQSVLPSSTGISKKDAGVVTVGSYPESLNTGSLQRVSQLMFDEGMLSNPIEVATQIAHLYTQA